MKEYIVHAPKDNPCAVEQYTSFYGEPIKELVRCKNCVNNLQIGTEMYCIYFIGLGIKIPIGADDYCSRADKEVEYYETD